MMHGRGKLAEAIVAVNPANKAERSAAELVERRAETKGNAGQQNTRRTQCRISVSQTLDHIRQAFAGWTRGGSLHVRICAGARGNSRPYRDVLSAALHAAIGTKGVGGQGVEFTSAFGGSGEVHGM